MYVFDYCKLVCAYLCSWSSFVNGRSSSTTASECIKSIGHPEVLSLLFLTSSSRLGSFMHDVTLGAERSKPS